MKFSLNKFKARFLKKLKRTLTEEKKSEDFKFYLSPFYILAILLISIFIVEGGLMWLFHRLPPFPSPRAEGITDAFLLTVFLSPVLYFLVFRPLLFYINKYKKTEEKNLYLSSFPELNPDPIIEIDFEGKIHYANPSSRKAFPDLFEQGASHPIIRSIVSCAKNVSLQKTSASSSGREKIYCCYEVNYKDRIYEHHISILPNTQRMRSYIFDITEGKENQEKFRWLLESAPDGIFVVNAEGKIEFINVRAEKMLGYKREELIGKPIEVLIPPRWREPHSEYCKNYFSSPLPRPMGIGLNISVLCKDGSELPVEISLSPLPIKEKTLVLGIMRDISERKKAEKELKQAQEMLMQTEKLAALGKLVANMAHEVNNPLMIISGKAQLSLMEEIENNQIKQNLNIIMEQCQRAKDIIQRLLKFSRPAKGDIKEVNINDTIEFVVQLIEHQYSLANIKIIKNYASGLPLIKIDEKQIQEVFINLLKNAEEAMPEGGTITITTSQKGEAIRIDFQDTGEGISKENMKKIFDPFFTTKEKGTGLGLSVCYGIITSYGGELKYKSKPGEGTTAIILLPIGGGGLKTGAVN